jgi:hypothetical protein
MSILTLHKTKTYKFCDKKDVDHVKVLALYFSLLFKFLMMSFTLVKSLKNQSKINQKSIFAVVKFIIACNNNILTFMIIFKRAGLTLVLGLLLSLPKAHFPRHTIEPCHDKTNIMGLRPAWIQTSLGIHASITSRETDSEQHGS